jgi:Mg2+/Co2+ transporter CorB
VSDIDEQDEILDEFLTESREVLAEGESNLVEIERERMRSGRLDLERINVEDIMVPRNEIAGLDVSDDWDDILDQLREMDSMPRWARRSGTARRALSFASARLML